MLDNINSKEAPTHFYGGFCPLCECYHHLDNSIALPHAIKLRSDLITHGCLDFEQPIEKRKPEFLTSGLFDDYGKMFGVLVCKDAQNHEVVLKAFSYGYAKEWICENWVPPIFDHIQYEALGQKGNSILYPLTDEIKTKSLNTLERNILVKKRREASQSIMEEYLDLYQIHTATLNVLNIRKIFHLKKQIPMGTADCCAPKLLSYAFKNGLTPISISEFYYGSPGRDGMRQSGEFYSSCIGKCHPILGTILCGAENVRNLAPGEIRQYYSEGDL